MFGERGRICDVGGGLTVTVIRIRNGLNQSHTRKFKMTGVRVSGGDIIAVSKISDCVVVQLYD